MKKILVFSLLLIVLFSTIGCTKQESDEIVFKIGAIPDQNISDLNRRFDEFSKYLSEKTGLKVEYVPSQDYSALVNAFERGEIHLAWFGGLTGVQARSMVEGSEAIAQRPRDSEFHSVFIANKDLNLNSINDIKGKSFTFGSESSTSGHLMPRFFMVETGIDPENDLNGKPNYSGSHDNTIKLVESGAYQVGALNEAVMEKAIKNGTVDLNKVSIFYTTPAYFDYNWTINNVDNVFDEGTKEKVKNALLEMNEDENSILELFQTDKFVESKNENYDAIKKIAIELKIISE